MTAREMSLVEGYVSASDFLLTSKIQDIPVWLIREIIRSGLMVSSRVVRWASWSFGTAVRLVSSKMSRHR
jgi:hypothetical protein